MVKRQVRSGAVDGDGVLERLAEAHRQGRGCQLSRTEVAIAVLVLRPDVMAKKAEEPQPQEKESW
jgi:hypothetical protein